MSDNMTQEKQDLHITEPAKPDAAWSRTQPLYIPPSKEQLDKPHQLVTMKNTSDVTITVRGVPQPQKHVIIDRHNQGHELDPGQSKEIDMLVSHIEFFLRERCKDRLDHLNRIKPQHPIEVVGFDPERVLREFGTPQPPAEQSKQRETLSLKK